MMSGSDSVSELSGYCELIKGITVFYLVPHDVEKSLIKGQNEMHAMAEIIQRCINNLRDSNNATFSTTVK